MYAIVNSGVIESTGNLQVLFPHTSFPGAIPPDDFKSEHGLQQVVEGEQKDVAYYEVVAGPMVRSSYRAERALLKNNAGVAL